LRFWVEGNPSSEDNGSHLPISAQGCFRQDDSRKGAKDSFELLKPTKLGDLSVLARDKGLRGSHA